jgi:hypothetical protein
MSFNPVLPELHVNQKHCKKHSKRFTVLCCGRRFGKTTLAIDLLVNASKEPRYLAYCAPTYKMLNKTWRIVKAKFRKLIAEKSEALKQLILINGTVIDFWSLDNEDSIRGNAYHFIIIDECAIIRNFKSIFDNSIRPLLTDYEGGCWFLSTPKGYYNDFYEISQIAQNTNDWAYFQMPTLANPNIKESEIESAKEQLPLNVFRQEYLAEFVNYEGNQFAEAFDYDKHIVDNIVYNPKENIYLSFDFNITNSILVCQHYANKIHILREYHTTGWDLPTLCEKIKQDYPNQIYLITGDASGSAGSAYTVGNVSAYELIKGYFNVLWKNFTVPKANPSQKNSRLQTNLLLSKIEGLKIDSSCKLLIKDLQMVVCDKQGKIDKSDSTLTHLLDCFRYYLWAYHYQTFKTMLFDKTLIEKN